MSESTDIEKLIRLKRYEQPPTEFIEEFVKNFQERQRAELLRRSARSLLWERVNTYFDEVMAPKWGWAVASAVAMAALVVWVKPPSPPMQPSVVVQPSADSGVFVVNTIEPEVDKSPAVDERFLIARHYDGGFTDSPRGTVLTTAGMPLGDDARFR